MDKFGIFNLLSSLLNGASEKNGDSDTGNPFALPNAVKNAESVATEKRAILPPLQTSMLSVMKSHDEFYKRVMKNNETKKK